MAKVCTFIVIAGITIFALSITFSTTGAAGEPALVSAALQKTPSTALPQQQSAAPQPEQFPVLPATHPAASLPQDTQIPASPPSHQKPVPVLTAPPSEKEQDRVLSHGEVDRELYIRREDSGGDPSSDGFFVSAQGENEERDDVLYSGLMRRIEMFIRYFQTRGRDKFELYLTRSGKYEDMMRAILAKYGLPGDLIYLALIESGFSPKAYSVARAAGPWQFIAETGRRYGLRIDWWTDERRDYEKSTHAAASYLKDLYEMFDSWPLATAAYNAGEGKISRAVNRYNSVSYVELIRHRYLKQETKDYVPKMIAALTIAKEPEKYGFGDVKYEDPLVFDKVNVPGGTELAAMGRIIGVPYESLRDWNPELRRFCTPPNRETYELRLPSGYGKVAEERIDEIRTGARVTFLLHTVKKGETLSSLADRYRTQPSALQELNGMKKTSLGRNARLVIPVTGLSADEAVPGKEMSAAQVEAALKRHDEGHRKTRTAKAGKRGKGTAVARKSTVLQPAGKREMRHVVKRGDTLSKIARVYGVNAGTLSERNRLKQGQGLIPGRVLFIPLES